MRLPKPASAMIRRGVLAGLQNATSCPRFFSSLAMGRERLNSPRSFEACVVTRNFTWEALSS